MAFGNVLRRSASAVVPLAIRAIGGQRYHHCSALLSAVNHRTLSRSSFPSILQYSSTSKRPSSDASLLRVIETEIKCAQESEDHDQVNDVPDAFPFKIEDNPGQQTISLSRDYQSESVLVEVHMPDLVTGDNDDGDDDDTEKSNQSSIPLVVRVSKKNGPCLEFGVTAFPDEISIDSLSVKDPQNSEDQIFYEGPDFSDLDENLQKAFHKYLEIRGIKPSATNFLHEYMINKDSREYTMWLKNLKKFVEA
ncbi:Mitochondrial glycoprotein [Actinidia chinensis var. chinensis]|uniref:Mitochondrial glycoprotein n=1 Tax=Actinidia chinensis var. chinensis TaxID=1590841 RepID=A0A2R6RWX3_ACTCC|nr:Mitochondrial glycoprotein [Actinidia chinensis var. chinensis]